MAIEMQCISVVVPKSAILASYPGGLARYEADCPNRTFLQDNHLTRVGFMDPGDVGVFVKQLEQRGLRFLDSKDTAIDIVVIDMIGGPTVPCDWIEFATGQGGAKCWLRGTSPGKISRSHWEAEKFTLFYGGPFSQWHPSLFTVNGIQFSHAEQFMMYSKATLFGDRKCAALILAAATPREQKALGKKAKGFDDDVWKLFREGVVFTGSYAKFSQNPELRSALLATRGTTLVEASPTDLIWGIGLAEDDPAAKDRPSWRGLNLLGEALNRVREILIWEHERGA